MKKFLVAISALIYLTTSVGATVHMHYCMDKLVTWSFGIEKVINKSWFYYGMEKSTNDKHCGKESKGCCKDEHKQVKLEKDHKISQASFRLSPISGRAITPAFFDYFFKYVSPLTEENPVTNAPPRTQNVSLFVLNCVFRI
ncbi:MAG: HYC_CC_PP family protein [Chitinophagaceae bacterium]